MSEVRTTIGIQVTGTNDIVYLADFLKAGNNLLELLSEVDISTSSDFKPTADWKLKILSYSSPATLVAESMVKEDRPDNRTIIIETTLEGIDNLRKTAERPQGWSDKALDLARDLAKTTQDTGDIIEVFSDGASVNYDASIIGNVDIIIRPGREIYGSLQGVLERLNSHGDFNFHLYEPILGRRIRGELMDKKDMTLKQKVISLYERDVIVSGLLQTNISGEVISAKIKDIDSREAVSLIKDASEVTAIWDITNGVDPVDYVRGMRDDG